MNSEAYKTGNFTLPGEAGYEDLTLELARRWGADTVRDSDGTVLSDRILSAGYNVYSTLCLVRADNAWARAHMDKIQQNYLMSYPAVATSSDISIDLLDGYFREQFQVNFRDDPKKWWQVFDRTTGGEITKDQWSFDASKGTVSISTAITGHKYTVNFLVYRTWEEISMYNHITNNWGDREHLIAIDPIYPETQEHILRFLQKWLDEHPMTDVVRFTSMFYNAAWFWGDKPELKYIYSDWGAYDFTVNPKSMTEFEKLKGYLPTSEDFVNNGLYNSTHNAPTKVYLDWVDFINAFVVDFGKQCVDLVHRAGKKAYMFYDDQWIGTEPYSDRFKDFGFDGLIKCVFNAFEARKCAGVESVAVRELRLHPYLFPTGLKGEPTFKEGGNPALDAANFWIDTRRALLREPVDRIGLGGYLHLVEPYPDFIDYIEKVTQEFRMLMEFHKDDKPYTSPFKVAVLTAWGKLRSWICSGHFVHGLHLNELIESLAGLPVEVEFISFDDILKGGISKDVKVIINCGEAGSSWSGGSSWESPVLVQTITDWIGQGGGLIGIAEPSATQHSSQFFQLSDVLGVDRDTGLRVAQGKYAYQLTTEHFITEDSSNAFDLGKEVGNIFVLGGETQVLADKEGSPRIATHEFNLGRSVYFSGHKFTRENTRLIHRAIYWAAAREGDFAKWTCSNVETECAYYPNHRKLVVINNSGVRQETDVFNAEKKRTPVALEPHDIKILEV
jgi:beta-D-galactosyl-(1->4)-L-rhamnose phosphorylase